MKDILFFKNKNYLASDLFPKIKIKKDFLIKGVKPLSSASSNHLTIFDTRKYLYEAIKTKSLICSFLYYSYLYIHIIKIINTRLE